MDNSWKSEYQNNSYYYRGLLIDVFSQLELAMDMCLSSHFVKLNTIESNDFKNIILDRLTFESKRTALKTLLDVKATKSGFVKTNSNSFPNGKLIEEIRLLNLERINFAHYVHMVPWSKDDSIITLVEHRDSIKFKSYTLDKFNKIIERIQKAADEVRSVYGTIANTP